jgi:hypothetical protein
VGAIIRTEAAEAAAGAEAAANADTSASSNPSEYFGVSFRLPLDHNAGLRWKRHEASAAVLDWSD